MEGGWGQQTPNQKNPSLLRSVTALTSQSLPTSRFCKLLLSFIFLTLKRIFFPLLKTLKPQALCWFSLSFIWSYPSASSLLLKCCFQNSLQAASDSLSSKKHCYEYKAESWSIWRVTPKYTQQVLGEFLLLPSVVSRANFSSFPPGLERSFPRLILYIPGW